MHAAAVAILLWSVRPSIEAQSGNTEKPTTQNAQE
ncbi:hypothetical protein BRADI_2g05075v3 [Brachypodium distachyon]|uniref:Uncharacterized protein n=1 Tax=Brachypodium distachyon TaxID=15368 RepID=A0A2K2D724_BRADI|nr:hypothetical protein BRADI_2g05075v3 [Brachypodium distachyon]